MSSFDPHIFGPLAAELLLPERLNDLGPGRANQAIRPVLDRLDPESLCPAGKRLVDREMAACCCAGLWLYHDFLDRSHTISQSVETPSGSYWHAIMHRREGDFSNSKYWMRRVGEHPTFGPLAAAARERAAGEAANSQSSFLAELQGWDPFRWIDLCESAVAGSATSTAICRDIQQVEWRLLFQYCFDRAFA